MRPPLVPALLAVLLAPLPAAAQEELASGEELGLPVVILPFGYTNEDGWGLAQLVPELLAEELVGCPDVLLLQDYDPSGRCRRGERACELRLAAGLGARLAIGGVADVEPGGQHLEVELYDVRASEMLLGFEMELPGHDATTFGQAVARLVRSSVCGAELGLSEEAREQEVALSPEATEALLRGLEEASRGLEQSIPQARARLLPERHLSLADLESRASDATPPWERLGMGRLEYLHYRNSGLPLDRWRVLARGRAGQLHLRVLGGGLRGPVDGWYHARFALDGETLDLVDLYAFQAVEDGFGAAGSLAAAVGLSPGLELELGAGRVSGSFLVENQQEVTDRVNFPSEGTRFPSTSWRAWAQLALVAAPAARLRPSLGLGAVAWRGTGVMDHAVPAREELPRFEAPLLWGPRASLGGELSLYRPGGRGALRGLDLLLRLPVDLLLLGRAVEVEDEPAEVLEELQEPPESSRLGLGLELGLSLRFLGSRGVGLSPDDYGG